MCQVKQHSILNLFKQFYKLSSITHQMLKKKKKIQVKIKHFVGSEKSQTYIDLSVFLDTPYHVSLKIIGPKHNTIVFWN